MTSTPRDPDPSNEVVIVEACHQRRCYELSARKNDALTRAVQATGRFYEDDLLDAISNMQLSGVYIDVGAHIGNHATFFAQECMSTKVVAFEPNDNSYELLVDNARRHGFETRKLAIHDRWMFASIRDDDPINRARSYLVSDGDDITCARLDDFSYRDVAVIKIDVEGLETDVIRSAKDTIARCTPLIVTEATSQPDIDAIRDELTPYGYRLGERYGPTPMYLWHPAL